ncbi:hypothetical protein ABK040_001380 [Willaertia magna]
MNLLDNSLQQLNDTFQINNLNNLNNIDLEINKIKIQDSKTKLNEEIKSRDLCRLDKFDFHISTDRLWFCTTIEEAKIPNFKQFEYVAQFGSKGNNMDEFENPRDIAIDNHSIYVADEENCRISKFNINDRNVVTVDNRSNTLLVGDRNYCKIYRYSKNGKLLDQYCHNFKDNDI